MTTLREIRRQLESTANIRKITQAMEMVAASRLRKAQRKAEQARPYSEKLRLILENLIAVTGDIDHPLIQKRSVKKTGFIVVAGDRGLCGGYNQTVFAQTEAMLKKYQPHEVELYLFGRKAIDYFSSRQWPVKQKIPDWGGKITYPQIEAFAHSMITTFLTHGFDEVWLFYTQFVNMAARKIIVEKFLPIERPKIEEKEIFRNTIIEPSAEGIYKDILPLYLIIKMLTALNESYASELAARIFAMRAATKNADERIETLTSTRNKLRQSGITRDLIEIISCAESLNK